MRRTRHVTLPVRSWQYIGLLVVSLACLTLGLVARDREGKAGSLAGPELDHKAPHDVDACPNSPSPFTKTPSSYPKIEDNWIRTVRNDIFKISPSSDIRNSRSRTADRSIRTFRASDVENRLSAKASSRITERARAEFTRDERSSRRCIDTTVRLPRSLSDSQLARTFERRSQTTEQRENSDRQRRISPEIRQARTYQRGSRNREQRSSVSLDRRQDEQSRFRSFDHRRTSERGETISSYRPERRETVQRVDARRNVENYEPRYNRELAMRRSRSADERRERIFPNRRENRDASQRRTGGPEIRLRADDRFEIRDRAARSFGRRESMNGLLIRDNRDSDLRMKKYDVRQRQSRSLDRIRSDELDARERSHRFAERRSSMESRINERRQRIMDQRLEPAALRNSDSRKDIKKRDNRQDIRYKNDLNRDDRTVLEFTRTEKRDRRNLDNSERNDIRRLSKRSADTEHRREWETGRRINTFRERNSNQMRENSNRRNRSEFAIRRSRSESEINRHRALSESRNENIERTSGRDTDIRTRTESSRSRQTIRMDPELREARRREASRDRLARVDSRGGRVDLLRGNRNRENRVQLLSARVSRSDSELNLRENRKREVPDERRTSARSLERLSFTNFQRERIDFPRQNMDRRHQVGRINNRRFVTNSERKSEKLEQRRLVNAKEQERASNRNNIRSNVVSSERRRLTDSAMQRLENRFSFTDRRLRESHSREIRNYRNDLRERSGRLADGERNMEQRTLADRRKSVSLDRISVEQRRANRRSVRLYSERDSRRIRRQTSNDNGSRRAKVNTENSRASDDSHLLRRFDDRTEVPAVRILKNPNQSRRITNARFALIEKDSRRYKTERRVVTENDSRKSARMVLLVPDAYRDVEFRMGMTPNVAVLKGENYYKYNLIYEVMRQAFIIGLCTVYGLSIYYRKRTFSSSVARQTQRFIAW